MRLNSNVLLLLLLISSTSCVSHRMQKSLDNALAGNGESQMQTEVISCAHLLRKDSVFWPMPGL